tara:strand:+ start:39260 stop:40588 length:1329 start_codon:yes stop_codon:yes gene_type:complete
MIKNIRLELFVFALITINIFVSYKFDNNINDLFHSLYSDYNKDYIIEFFVKITELGDSLWFFSIFFALLFFSLFFKKTNLLNNSLFQYIKNFSLSGIVYLAATGIVIQLIKHLVGRPRPNHTNSFEVLEFNFFTLNSDFHSFPSGHASTIFIVCLLCGALLPRLKYFFYSFGILVAISRVVVGAHFVTDIVGGILVSIIVYKTLNFFFQKNFSFLKLRSITNDRLSLNIYFIIIFSLIALLLTIGPTIDLYISSLFYFGDRQFLLQSYFLITTIFRKFLMPLILIYILFLPMLSKQNLVKKIFFKYVFSLKDIAFIWVAMLFSLVGVVNFLLKDFWGRARPNDILQLGGEGIFTPWYKLSYSCYTNCSFVSGDASVGFSIIVLYFITKKIIYIYLSVLLGSLLGFIRIAEGGHFFSDVIFSYLVVTVATMFLGFLYYKQYDK